MEETEWPGLETQVRKLVSELVQPTIRRSMELKEELDRVKKVNEKKNSRIDDIEVNFNKMNNKMGVVEEYSGKMMEFESRIQVMQSDFYKDRERLQNEFETLSKNVFSNNESISVLQNQKEVLRVDLNKQGEELVNAKEHFESRTTSMNQILSERITQGEARLNDLETRAKEADINIQHITQNLEDTELCARRTERLLEDLKDNFKSLLANLKSQRKSDLENVEGIRRMSIGFEADLKEQLKLLTQNINFQLPPKQTLEISEYLHNSILDPKTKRKLAEYDQVKLSQFDESQVPQSILEEIQKAKTRAQEIIDTPIPPEPRIPTRNISPSSSVAPSSKSGKRPSNFKSSREGFRRTKKDSSFDVKEMPEQFENTARNHPGSRASRKSESSQDKPPLSRNTPEYLGTDPDEQPPKPPKSTQFPSNSGSRHSHRVDRNTQVTNDKYTETEQYLQNRSSQVSRQLMTPEELLIGIEEEKFEEKPLKNPEPENSLNIDEVFKKFEYESNPVVHQRKQHRDKNAETSEFDFNLSSERGFNPSEKELSIKGPSESSKTTPRQNHYEETPQSHQAPETSEFRQIEEIPQETPRPSQSPTKPILNQSPVESMEIPPSEIQNLNLPNYTDRNERQDSLNTVNTYRREDTFESAQPNFETTFSPNYFPQKEFSYPENFPPQEVVFDLNMLDDEQIEQLRNLPPGQEVVDMFEDLREMVEELKAETERQTYVHEDEIGYLNDQMKQISEKIDQNNQNLESFKELYEKHSEETHKVTSSLDFQIKQAIHECNAAVSQRRRDNTDHTAEFRKIKAKLEQISGEKDKTRNAIDSLKKAIEGLVEVSRMNNALLFQDENDRDSMALIGYKSSQKTKTSKQVVSFDNQCISCTGQNPTLINAFKMACLSYRPSLVSYHSQRLARKDFLHAQAKVINSVWDNSVNDFSLLIRGAEVPPLRAESEPPAFLQTPSISISPVPEFPSIDRRSNRF